MIIPFIIGICAMSVIATIGAIILDKGKDGGIFFCGPATWVVTAFAVSCREIQHWARYHNRRSLLADKDGNIFAVPYWAAEAYCDKKDMNFISQRSENEKVRETARSMQDHEDEWGRYFLVAGSPNIRYAPKSVWKNYATVSKSEAKAIAN